MIIGSIDFPELPMQGPRFQPAGPGKIPLPWRQLKPAFSELWLQLHEPVLQIPAAPRRPVTDETCNAGCDGLAHL